MVNLHELNKYLKHHDVTLSDIEEVLAMPKVRTPRKPKQKRESYESWKLRNEAEALRAAKVSSNITLTHT